MLDMVIIIGLILNSIGYLLLLRWTKATDGEIHSINIRAERLAKKVSC